MIYYNVVSCVNGTTGTVFQAYKTKTSAIKNAYKRLESGCYNCVFVWVDDIEHPKNNKMLLELWKKVENEN